MRRAVWIPLLALLVMIPLSRAHSGPMSREEIPESLRTWIDWVLWGHEEKQCPFFQGDAEHRQCAWPSRLELDIGDRTGRFTQRWLADRESWVPLPGDATVWPQDVHLDGRPAVVLSRRGTPGFSLPSGRHVVTGVFRWSEPPPLLEIPQETGLLNLIVQGQPVPFPRRDDQGRLWLHEGDERAQEESRLEIAVHRLVADGVPLVLTTNIDLRVSGKSREALLGRALPENFLPMSLESPLPVRLEPDGRLRIQVRPGRWRIELMARHVGPADSLSLPSPSGIWDPEEVWVFDARPHLRMVSIEGVAEIDPQQTELPDDWKRLPAYLMSPEESMRLVEKRRGDSDPAPDRLSLRRAWWLDIDGGGVTISDAITGTMERSWRLEMSPPANLGRVAVNGVDQFITRLGEDAPAGVELRQGQVDLNADSRWEGDVSSIPAVNWEIDFDQVSGEMNIPPAWRLFHASGVDDVSGTWVSSWTLLDLFLVLVVTMAIGRLWGWFWGLIALVTLALTWIELGAPRWIWIAVLVGQGLVRGLPAGRAQRCATLYHRVALALLAIIVIPFMVQQVRTVFCPALEEPWQQLAATGSGGIGAVTVGSEYGSARDLLFPYALNQRAMLEVKMDAPLYVTLAPPPPSPPPPPAHAESSLAKLERADYSMYWNVADPKAVVQTGPGLPSWRWPRVWLSWRGPVERTQRLHLVLMPPALNFALAFVRVAALAVLVLCVLGLPRSTWGAPLLKRLGLARLTAVFVTLALAGAGPVRADEVTASDERLEELRDRLLAPPECFPDCATIPRMALEATPEKLMLRLEVHTAADTGVPLPGSAGAWLPERVLLDERTAGGLTRAANGQLWLRVPPGVHQVLMEGGLPDRETVQIPLPLEPHRVTAETRGWKVEGLREDGSTEGNLQITRSRGRDREAIAPGPLPAFVRVERELNLGLEWEVITKVVRMAPPDAAILIEVPLLAGESVTTAAVAVRGAKAQVSLAPQTSVMTWGSVLEKTEVIDLRAPVDVPWVEVWRVAAGPIWHLEVDGIPVVHAPERGEIRLREWRPWPGERVRIEVTRPEGLSGQTLTIDATDLSLNPGLRATDAVLKLTLRSSRGGQHTVTLPEAAELQSVAIEGKTQPIRQEGREVILPVIPGRQEATLSWRQQGSANFLFKAPEVRIGGPSVNAGARIAMPADRWILFMWGPRIGPTVLFWGLLIVSLLVSIGLGQIRFTPLRWYHWFLLSLGLTQAPLWVTVWIAAWLVGLGWRKERGGSAGNLGFNAFQVLLILATPLALGGLLLSIQEGLLGLPEMQIAGNGSTSEMLQWYLDRTDESLPRPWVLSVPLMVYRLLMLAWALWLAQALLRWLRWGWGCFTEGGMWRTRPKPPSVPQSTGAQA